MEAPGHIVEEARDCPQCDDWTLHEELNPGANNLTLRCTGCGNVTSEPARRERPVDLQAIFSDGPEARTVRMDVVTGDEVQVGDEFDHEGSRMLVTGLECKNGTRPRSSLVENLHVLYAKRFDKVVLRFSANLGERTVSFRQEVDPEHPVEVGQVWNLDGDNWVIKVLKSDQNHTVKSGSLAARNVRRAFLDPAPPRARPGQVLHPKFGRKPQTRGPRRADR